MITYLQITVGPYELLIDTRDVVEVIEPESSSGDASDDLVVGDRIWRDKTLPVISLRRVLGLSSSAANGAGGSLVYQRDGVPFAVLNTDYIAALLAIEDTAFSPVPQLTPQLADFIDGIYVHPTTKQQQLRLRRPLVLEGKHD